MSRILISGASGFIGRALAAAALARGEEVYVLASGSEAEALPTGLAGSSALRLPDEGLRSILENFQPDLVFHCAGSARPADSFAEPAHDFRSTVPVIQGLVEALRLAAPQAHLVLLSSAAVYGQPEHLPIRETASLNPVSPYGYHKWMGEILAREYAEVFGLKITTARIFSAYGPALTKQVVWDAIGKLSRPGSGEFPGTGEETRDFIYIDDLVAALFCLAARPGEGHEVFNVATGVETSIREVVATVARELGVPDSQWRFTGTTQPATPVHWRADISHLQGLGFASSIPLAEGVRRTVTWAREHVQLAAPAIRSQG